MANIRKKRDDLAKRYNLPTGKLMLVPATYWKRFTAFFIDVLIIELLIFSPFRKILSKLVVSDLTFTSATTYFESNPDILNKVTWIMIMVAFLVVMYFSVLQHKIRQTLGMMLFNLWVYTDDKELSYWKILLSNLSFLPIFPFIMLWIIDPIYMLFSSSRQRLMQRLAGIYIVEETNVGGII